VNIHKGVGGMDAISNKALIFIFLLLLSLSTADAITATLITGGTKITLNDTPQVYERSIGVRNDNDKTVYIFFEPAEDIEHMVEMDEYNISLEPGESRFVKFRLNVTENRFYDSRIAAVFSIENTMNISEEISFDKLAMEMKVMISPSTNVSFNSSLTDGSQDAKEETQGSMAFLFGGVIVAVAAGAVIWMFIRSSKRGDNGKRKKKY
jgi:hypothetical protein